MFSSFGKKPFEKEITKDLEACIVEQTQETCD